MSDRLFSRMKNLTVCIAVVLLCACSDEAQESTEQARPVLTVELVTPVQQSWSDTVVASGEVAPWQEAIIGAEVAGIRLQQVLVNVGDVVEKGQLLARYSEDTLRAELARLDAAVAEASANLVKADADAVRADKLEQTGAISSQIIQTYRTQLQVAKAQLASARAQRDAQALRLKYAQVKAPDDGIISARSATVGAVSNMGEELFRLVRRNRLEWRAEVSAELLTRLKPGLSVSVQQLDGTQVAGTLRQCSPTVDPGTRNGIAYVDLPVASGLVGGMYLAGRFTLATRDALVLPESAIVLRDGNQYLMKVNADNHVQVVKVTTGRRQQSAIEIVSGITEADRFIKSGGAFVGEGDLVQVVTEEAAAR